MKIRNNYRNLNKIPIFYQNYIFSFINRLKENFSEKLLSVILFGSVSRRKLLKSSDFDLLLIFSNEITNTFLLDKKIADLTIEFYKNNELKNEKGIKVYPAIQTIVLSLMELDIFRTLFYDIATDEIIIFDKDDPGLKFVKKIKNRIKEKELKRVYLGDNDFYWKRKKIRFEEIVEL